jgi:Spy/CpxP family protein refolding chaperone
MQVTTLRKPIAIASALLVAAALAFAGTGHAAGPQGPAGGPPAPAGGPPMSGGPMMSGGLVEHVIAQMKERLSLDSSQLQMFDAARAKTLAARDQAMAQRAGVRAKIDAELAKPEPDLASVAALFDGVEEQSRATRHQARDQWLKLYANLRPDQKALVRDALRERLSHADGSRERIRERMQQQRAPS